MLQAKYFKWLPNTITGLRVAAGVVAMVYAINNMWVAAFWIYFAALASDFLDGLAAKKLNAITKFGELFDSLSDGWLVAVGLIGLSATGHLAWWITVLATATGFAVQAERRLLPRKARIPPKAKKIFAVACLFVAWVYIILSFAALAYGWHWWYVLVVLVVLAASASLKRHRLRSWLAGRS